MKDLIAGHLPMLMMCDGQGGWGSHYSRGGGRPRKERPVVHVNLEPTHPLTVFNLMLMLHRRGVWMPQISPKGDNMRTAFGKEVMDAHGLSDDSEVWPLVDSLGVDRKQADLAAQTQFPGCLFCLENKKGISETQPTKPGTPQLLCVDPVLSLAIMARTNGSFYRADHSPDYTLGHLLEQCPAFNDPSIPGEALYPLWHPKVQSTFEKNSKTSNKRSA